MHGDGDRADWSSAGALQKYLLLAHIEGEHTVALQPELVDAVGSYEELVEFAEIVASHSTWKREPAG